MAARAATDSTRTSGHADGFGSRITPAVSDTLDPGPTAAVIVIARARRRLVDALMDAGRIRSIRSARSAVPAPSAESPRARRFEAADFIGLALTVVAGRSGLSAAVHGAADVPWPATPALDALSALFRALADHGAVPADASLRFDAPAVRGELVCLGRLAVLPASGVAAVAATAPEIAGLLCDFATRATEGGAAGPPACAKRWSGPVAFGVAALESRIEGSTVGPEGDNLPDAVVLTRLLLRRLPVGSAAARLPCAVGREARPIGPEPRPTVIPIYPAADRGLFRSIAQWRLTGLPTSRRCAFDRMLGRPLTRWGRDAVTLATLSVGSRDWLALRAEAGCSDLRLRVVGGTAVVLIDRSLGAVRDAVRQAIWALARQGRAALSPQACAAVMAAALAFHGATGQTLVCRRLDGSVLLMAVEVDWIDPWGTRRSDADAIADMAPLAAIRLLDAARTALADHPACWRLVEARGADGARQLSVRLADGLLTPAEG
ncbi:hypothetical protein [Thalassobaculum salexigens]|uniref:hypothetical protein n=1 Tax=Thalassobaculum salexigens TaxID=455360 RepID=UPI0003FF0A2C|nr:hypothetical protein [Thalassobaculum salexigens]